jgi:hypothetical protein
MIKQLDGESQSEFILFCVAHMVFFGSTTITNGLPQ